MRIRAIAVLIAAIAPLALGVTTGRWTQTTEADFKTGTLHQVVASGTGELHLSRAVTTLLDQDPRFSLVSALAEAPDGSLYLGTGPNGLLLKWKDGKAQDVLSLGAGSSITALAIDAKGNVYVGVTGATGRVLRIGADPSKPQTILQDPSVQYVWALICADDGTLYVGTGPEGNLYQVTPDGRSRILFHSTQANILSLAISKNGPLYAGASPKGLIYRIDRKTGEGFVLYNAPETDITSLALDDKGNLYACTGSDSETSEEESTPATGQPERTPAADTPIRAEPPVAPKPPELPNPTPGEPEPIPKNQPVEPKHLVTQGRAADPATMPALGKPIPTPAAARPRPAPASPSKPPATGNAVYRITPEGFVTEILRQQALFYSIVSQQGSLLIGSGSDGAVYTYDLATEEATPLARVDAMDVTTLLVSRAGKVYMGLSNAGALAEMTPGFAATGSFLSPVLDAKQVSRFGVLQLIGTLAKDSSLSVAFRSGNVQDADDAGWSKWSDDAPAAEFIKVPAPSARFLQYRLTLSSKTGQRTPSIEQVSVSYQVPNLPPRIKSVTVSRSGGDAETVSGKLPEPTPRLSVSWEADDPNNDTLRYTLSYQMGRKTPWIELKKDLTATSFDWDTKTVADGRYQLRVLASDAPSNPGDTALTATRLSDAVIVDNTPPVIGDIIQTVQDGIVKIQLKVVDRTSTVAGVEFAVDSADDWQATASSDNIFDSPEETVSFQTAKLTPGSHQIAIRATDSLGNRSHTTVVVTVEQNK